MKRRDFLLSAAGSAALLGCERSVYRRASDAEVRQAFYRHDGRPEIAIISVISTTSDNSMHTGLLINGDQRVLYDPAGSYDPSTEKAWQSYPRKYDIHYGLDNRALIQYEKYHARLGYYVLRQTVPVPLSVANQAIRLSEEKGETYKYMCANSVSWVLGQLPGFGGISQTMLPQTIRKDFARLPNVSNKILRENDEGQNYQGTELTVGNPDDIAPPRKPEYNRGEPA